MGKKIVILGGKGDAATIGRAIMDANRRGDDTWELAGLLNDRYDAGSIFEGIPVLGGLSEAHRLLRGGVYFINAILRIDGNPRRIRMFEDLKIPDDRLATFVHPMTYVPQFVNMGPGCAIMPGVCISPETQLGRGCIVLQSATLGHNNTYGDFCHISAQACVGAYLKIGKGVHIGMNATIRENVTIGDYAALGAGSVLLQDIPERQIFVGNPARFLRNIREE